MSVPLSVAVTQCLIRATWETKPSPRLKLAEGQSVTMGQSQQQECEATGRTVPKIRKQKVTTPDVCLTPFL